jgi:hypothetical protein
MRGTILPGLVSLWLLGCAHGVARHSAPAQHGIALKQRHEDSPQRTATEGQRLEQDVSYQSPLVAPQDRSGPREILITSEILSPPYLALGKVAVNTLGFSTLGAILNDSLFRSRFVVAASGVPLPESQERIGALLREQARKKYGSQVDAVMNVGYQLWPDGEGFAEGVAVHFLAPPPKPFIPIGRYLESQLRELRDLWKKGLISQAEYDEKRSRLLEGL